MGEVEPKVVTQVNPGKVAIDVAKVVMPTEESIRTLTTEWTGDGKWCQFPVRTSQRSMNVSPGSMGQEEFDGLCEKAAAMYKTAQGVAFLAAIRAEVAVKPLEANVSITEVAPIAK